MSGWKGAAASRRRGERAEARGNSGPLFHASLVLLPVRVSPRRLPERAPGALASTSRFIVEEIEGALEAERLLRQRRRRARCCSRRWRRGSGRAGSAVVAPRRAVRRKLSAEGHSRLSSAGSGRLVGDDQQPLALASTSRRSSAAPDRAAPRRAGRSRPDRHAPRCCRRRSGRAGDAVAGRALVVVRRPCPSRPCRQCRDAPSRRRSRRSAAGTAAR